MNKDTILEAAAVIFSQKGYHAASMQDIAEAVRLQKASLYHHVDSKQEILKGLLDYALDQLIAQISEVVEAPLPADQKLRLSLVKYLGMMLEQRELASVLLLEHRSLEPELRIQHIRRRDEFEKLWRVLIEEGVKDGLFTCTDVALITRALLGALNWTVTWYRVEDGYSPGEIADLYSDFILNGLMIRLGKDGFGRA